MNKSLVIAALLAATAAALPSIPGAAFAAGMGGGGSSGMGGASGGGMGGGGTGIGTGGASGMGGGRGIAGGGMFRGPAADFDRPAATPGDNSASADNYTYQCVTTFGRCSFVAPAMLRANSLRSGAECACSGGQVKGRVE